MYSHGIHLCLLGSGVYKSSLNKSFGANSNTYHKNALVGTTTATKYKQDLSCIHRVYARLQKTVHKDLWGCNKVRDYENAIGKDKAVDFIFMNYIIASKEISLYSLSTQDNADSLCKKLKVKR